MSECVVRMKMPKCCDDCDANYDCCACGIIGAFWFRNPRYKEFDSSKERLPNCPIICQLPEGHERLVSEKDVRWVIDDIVLEITKRIGHVPMTKNETMEYVNRLPTIVPAERREV